MRDDKFSTTNAYLAGLERAAEIVQDRINHTKGAHALRRCLELAAVKDEILEAARKHPRPAKEPT